MESIVQFGINFFQTEIEYKKEEDKYDYYKEYVLNYKKPLAILDLELFDKNIEEILKKTNKTIRIASKSIRCLHLLNYFNQKSSKIQGIMCYSGEEALFLIKEGFNDLLLGYPIVNKSIITDLLKSIAKVTFMVDLIEHLKILENLGKKLNKQVRICIDIDMSYSILGIHFGVFRSKCQNLDYVKKLLEFIKQSKNLNLVGVMGYEAQLAGIAENNPNNGLLMGYAIRALKYLSISSIFEFRKNVVKLIKNEGFKLEFVNGGGTGSLSETDKDDSVTEITVGSGFYSPHLFDYYDKFIYHPSLFYAIEIVRNPFDNVYTCYGGGYIASGSLGIDKYPKIYLPKTATYRNEEGAGEVQTPIIYKEKTLKLGDPIFLRHSKAGELLEHFTEVLIIQKEKSFLVKTYRGEGKKF